MTQVPSPSSRPALSVKGEQADQRRHRASQVLAQLDAAMPEAKIELDYRTPLELLVAVLLSAQCTDRRVNLVTPALFADFPTAEDYARSTPLGVSRYISSLGLFRNKAKSLVGLGHALGKLHGGEVPIARAALAKLPGVGPKTAGVVSMHLGGDQAFPVDTHVMRLSRRLGFSRRLDPDEIEKNLQVLFARDDWFKAHQLLIWHGRRVCHARSPECHRCVVAALCPRLGVSTPRPTLPSRRRARP
jgi:endonuclease-3